MQNTIVKEFENNPNVVTRVFNEGDTRYETWDWVQVFWSNYYMRQPHIYDSDGSVGQYYDMGTSADKGIPFGRGFIIDQSGYVVLPFFGHNPQMAIEKTYELTGATSNAAPLTPLIDSHFAAQLDTPQRRYLINGRRMGNSFHMANQSSANTARSIFILQTDANSVMPRIILNGTTHQRRGLGVYLE